MTLHLHFDHHDRVYFTLTCDRCTARFTCYDDACYSLASLCTAATFAGWHAGPRLPDRCSNCARTTPPVEQTCVVAATHIESWWAADQLTSAANPDSESPSVAGASMTDRWICPVATTIQHSR